MVAQCRTIRSPFVQWQRVGGRGGGRDRGNRGAQVRRARARLPLWQFARSSESNKKLIESVTPPDFTNEISKYQFHGCACARLTVGGWGCGVWGCGCLAYGVRHGALDAEVVIPTHSPSRLGSLNWNKMSFAASSAPRGVEQQSSSPFVFTRSLCTQPPPLNLIIDCNGMHTFKLI